MPLTPEAKRILKDTIRELRVQLCGPVTSVTQAKDETDTAKTGTNDHGAIHDEAERRYRLSVPIADAGLDEVHRRRRERIESWIEERARATKPKNKTELKATKDRLLLQAEKEAAATLINRLVLLRQLEAQGLSKPSVLAGGWSSKGCREFREFGPGLTGDETEGYATLLQLLFDELAGDLPGLFGDVGLTKLFPIPPATLRDVVERLDDPELVSAWTDDTTLGWVYQYWNDPDREALDEKLDAKKKIEPHEIASKTQMFTERYIVEWLLQNSLGLTWLAMCKKHGRKPDADRVLPALEERRAEWRKKREAGEVAVDALMRIEGELEEHWKYYVPQPIPDDAVEKAPESVRAIKILDPACGSGHFLVIAFDLLVALYREEARHLGKTVTEKEIAESILENNLHGIDIDPRAIQIAAAGLYLKAKTVSRAARPKRVNLVAPVLQLGNLPPDDPAVVVLRKDLKTEVGIPEELTNRILSALAGVDHLGSLLKVDAAVEDAIKTIELEFERSHGQGDLFGGFPAQQVKLSVGEAKSSIVDKLEQFLAKHSKSEDLGLRLDGEQLAAGVRFVRLAHEGTFDIVVGNPPYSDIGLLKESAYVRSTYPKGKSNLYAAFLERSLELVRDGGVSALLTMRGWMYQLDASIQTLREHLLRTYELRGLVDLDSGAFEEVAAAQVVLSVACSVFRRAGPRDEGSIALRPTPPGDRVSAGMTQRKKAGLLAQAGRYPFNSGSFDVIEGAPLVYSWPSDLLERYAKAPKLGVTAPVRQGLATADNLRFLRRPWEVHFDGRWLSDSPEELRNLPWVPYIKGGKGRCWFEPLSDLLDWEHDALALRVWIELYRLRSPGQYIKNETFYFRRGVAFAPIGSEFTARAHRYRSVIGHMGASVFPDDMETTLCFMNSRVATFILESLNPGAHFEVGDVSRLPVLQVEGAKEIVATLRDAFVQHEVGREPSVEFRKPGPSGWDSAQQWAKDAIDRPAGAPLEAHRPVLSTSSPSAIISFAFGIAMGRLDANGAGTLGVAPDDALPDGILFLSDATKQDSLEHPASSVLKKAWAETHRALREGADVDHLRSWLRKKFFAIHNHKTAYDKRPIYFPLSSKNRTFVAWISIHRWHANTLKNLLADHLKGEERRLKGMVDDLVASRATAGAKAKDVEERLGALLPVVDELREFISTVETSGAEGPRPSDRGTTEREVGAPFVLELRDGVMVNSAALWPLLEPQWKDPKKWWKQLANQAGPKGTHFDWSHLAARYFPTRVRKKCHEDPSLAVAHKCFWELHPAKAYAWELRLQDEIRPDFTIDEPGSNEARAKFLIEHEREAADLLAKEVKRRDKKAAKADDEDDAGPLFEQGEDAEAEESDD